MRGRRSNIANFAKHVLRLVGNKFLQQITFHNLVNIISVKLIVRNFIVYNV